ncbi:MAG: nucleotidyltransferase domain-containing protein [bacterium]
MTDVNCVLKALNEYFSGNDDVVMAFLFGSQAKAATHLESDMDIAVYFKRTLNDDEESGVWAEIEKLAGINIDFVVLNRAFPQIADSALKGIPIIIKDRNIYLRFLIRTISEAIDYRAFVESYWRIKQRRMHASY